MPLYEFKCKKCDKSDEQIVPATKKTIKCLCGGTMTKLFPSNTSFQLKGNWYKTTKSY